MDDPSAGEEKLRWRPWPCPECGGGFTPTGHLIERLGASGSIQQGEFEQAVDRQIVLLWDWAASCPHRQAIEIDLPRLAEGSEHTVYLERPNNVLKFTRPGTYGESYYLAKNGMVHQQSCWPLEYLIRLRLWERVFGIAPQPIGITESGQIVSRQPYVVGELPSQLEVDEYLLGAGLEPVKQSRWLWKESCPDEEFNIWVGDARNDNFVLTTAGMVPIDLRLWFNPGRLPS